MEKNMVALLIVVVVSSFLITGGVIAFYALSQSTDGGELSPGLTCNTLYDNDGSVNIVFISNEAQAKRYADFLLSVQPIASNQNSFNFYYVDSDIGDRECEIYKGVALLCYSKDVVREASICPNDYIVVLKEMPRAIRSSAFANVMSLNTAHSLTVFVHEFGHAFANLAEEYMTEARIPKGSRNCQEECTGFGGIEDGCFEGCTNNQHSRSIESGVMRTLSTSDYGTFNEYLIRERIDEENAKDSSSVITGQVTSDELRAIYNQDEDGPEDCVKPLNYYEVDFSPSGATVVSSEPGPPGCIGSLGYGSNELRLRVGGVEISQKINAENIFTDFGAHVEEHLDELDGETYANKQQTSGDRKTIVVKYPLVDEGSGTGSGGDTQPDPVTLLLRSPIDPDTYRPPTEAEISAEGVSGTQTTPAKVPRVVEENGQVFEESEVEIPLVPTNTPTSQPVPAKVPQIFKVYSIVKDNMVKIAENTVSPSAPVPSRGTSIPSGSGSTPQQTPTTSPGQPTAPLPEYDCIEARIATVVPEVAEQQFAIQGNAVDSSVLAGGATQIESTLAGRFAIARCYRVDDGTPVVIAGEIPEDGGFDADIATEDEIEEFLVTRGAVELYEFSDPLEIASFDQEIFAIVDREVFVAAGQSVAIQKIQVAESRFSLQEEITPQSEFGSATSEWTYSIPSFTSYIFNARFATTLTGFSISEPAEVSHITRIIALFWMGVLVGLILILYRYKKTFLKGR